MATRHLYYSDSCDCDGNGAGCEKCRPATTQALSCRHCGSGLVHGECYLERNEPKLSLLIIDLGDSCVVKAERGEKPTTLRQCDHLLGTGIVVFGKPFAELRAAIDGDKPVPRIERHPTDARYVIYWENAAYQIAEFTVWFDQWDVLCQLAGVEIPIWKGNGTWTQIGVESRDSHRPESFTIWRYER